MVVLSDDVGITALLQAMTCQGERHCEQGVIVARTEAQEISREQRISPLINPEDNF